MSDENSLVKECVSMLEKYYGQVQALPNDNSKSITLQGTDMAAWKNTYYPQLVKTKRVMDGEFFQYPLRDTRSGIGDDGVFCKYEYIQFMYRAYRFFLVNDEMFARNSGTRYIKECIDFVEPYHTQFANKGMADGVVAYFPSNKMDMWKLDYYVYLSLSGLIPDGQFFGDVSKDSRLGIGNDGAFAGKEILHFLYECCKFVYLQSQNQTPVWRFLFLYYNSINAAQGKSQAQKGDDGYAENIAKRIPKFIYAYTRGNAAIDMQYIAADHPVKSLTAYSDQCIYLGADDIQEDFQKYGTQQGKLVKDFIITSVRYGSINTGKVEWYGLTTGLMSLLKGAGYSTVKYLEGTPADNYLAPHLEKPPKNIPYPEEGFIHEFLHVMDDWCQRRGGKSPNPDGAGTYGYPCLNPRGMHGFYKFYGDILSCRVKDPGTGKPIGIRKEDWTVSPSVQEANMQSLAGTVAIRSSTGKSE
jgi:hypothetical protein